MSQRLRVAMVGLRAPWGVEGGVESAVAELAPRLARAGCEVTVYCRGRYNVRGPGVHEGVRLVDTPTIYRRSFEAFAHSALATPLASLGHDVVHLHACGPALFSGIPRWFRRNSVATIHGLDWERDKWGPTARAVLRTGALAAGHTADEIIAVSAEVRAWLVQNVPARVTTIPNGVSAHEHVAWDPGVVPGLKPGGYLLFLGRLVPEKDLLTLVRAARRTRLAHPIVIVGGAAYTDAYAAELRREAPASVVFAGPRFGREKAMLLSNARAFVFPSRVEGLPIALLEALAAGLPVVASDIPANLEVLGDAGAWRVPVGSVEAWAAALREVEAADPGTLARWGAEGRARAEARFGWDRVVNETLAVYDRVAGR